MNTDAEGRGPKEGAEFVVKLLVMPEVPLWSLHPSGLSPLKDSLIPSLRPKTYE